MADTSSSTDSAFFTPPTAFPALSVGEQKYGFSRVYQGTLGVASGQVTGSFVPSIEVCLTYCGQVIPTKIVAWVSNLGYVTKPTRFA